MNQSILEIKNKLYELHREQCKELNEIDISFGKKGDKLNKVKAYDFFFKANVCYQLIETCHILIRS